MALVEAMAGMMFFTTPCVSWKVTPCKRQQSQQQQQQQQRHIVHRGRCTRVIVHHTLRHYNWWIHAVTRRDLGGGKQQLRSKWLK
jgi:hypothetical protein